MHQTREWYCLSKLPKYCWPLLACRKLVHCFRHLFRLPFENPVVFVLVSISITCLFSPVSKDKSFGLHQPKVCSPREQVNTLGQVSPSANPLSDRCVSGRSNMSYLLPNGGLECQLQSPTTLHLTKSCWRPLTNSKIRYLQYREEYKCFWHQCLFP
mgnify:CR=1 FL=1